MEPKKKALTAAVLGTALGIGGLAAIAMPASAGDAPDLPAVSAESLVQSVATAKTPALGGKVEVSNNLGLPGLDMVPGAGNLLSLDSAEVHNDGNGRSRIAVHQGNTQETITHDGRVVWSYRSATNSVTKYVVPADAEAKAGAAAERMSDPTTAATQILAKLRESSDVTVDGTARVADRAAYELVLTPKPTERTLLREVRVAVDAETRLPLRLDVLTHGSVDPALQIAFSEVSFGPQDASRFTFTPPQGAKVTEAQPKVDETAKNGFDRAQQDVKVVGDGWDTVLTGKIPAPVLAGATTGAKASGKDKALDPMALLSRLGKHAEGAWGDGYVVSTKVGTAVVTTDGRFAAGAVPEQVLFTALGAR